MEHQFLFFFLFDPMQWLTYRECIKFKYVFLMCNKFDTFASLICVHIVYELHLHGKGIKHICLQLPIAIDSKKEDRSLLHRVNDYFIKQLKTSF